MKHAAKCFVIAAVITAILSVSGCKHDPNPPTRKRLHQGLDDHT